MMEKMIWLFEHDAHTPENGTITRHYFFSEYLKQLGYHIKIFASSAIHNSDVNMICDKRNYREMDIDGRDYIYIRTRNYVGNGSARIFNMFDYCRNLPKALKNMQPPDLIYGTSPHIFAMAAAIKQAKKRKIPCICEVQDLWPESIVEYGGFSRNNPAVRYLYGLEKRIYKRCDALVFTMEGGADYIREQPWADQIDFSKIYYINNGIDLKQFDFNKETYITYDPELERKDTFKVIYTGSLRTANDAGRIVDCAARIKRSGVKNIRFILYGEGNERAALERRCVEEDINNVVFRNFVPKNNVPWILTQADVCLLNYKTTAITRFGTSQNKLFEYMASGKPLLSTIHMGHSLIKRYDCGIELENASSDAMAKAVMEFYEMPQERREEMGRNARRGAADYDIPKLAKKMANTIETTMEFYDNKYLGGKKC